MARKQKTDSSKTDNTPVSWFSMPGNFDDVIISTRARLIRNLADFPFPVKMSDDDKERVQALVYDAFSVSNEWHFLDMSRISEPGRQILSDKNILKDALILHLHNAFP